MPTGMLENIGQPIGGSGIPLQGNESWMTDEYNADLRTPQQAIAAYHRMFEGDAKVGASANNLLWALMSAQWRVDAAKDEGAEGEKDAEFVRSVLMPGETYGYAGLSNWSDTLRNALLAPIYGFSILEKINAYRPSDSTQIFGALELRHPKTIRHFNLAKTGPSRLESVTQYAQTKDGKYGEITIPADRLIVITFAREGDSYWGKSILRRAHFHWKRKRELLKWDVIVKERMGGVFWTETREGMTASPEQIAAAKLVLENFRIYEKLGLHFPTPVKFNAVFPPSSNGTDFITSARYDDEQIEQSMMSQFQSLGTGQKGARSVGEVQLDFMLLAWQGAGKTVEDAFMPAIVELVRRNRGERKKYPRLACENFLQMKPDRLALVLEPLIKCGAIRIDKPLRVLLREKFSLGDEDEKTLEPIPGQIQPGAAGPAPGQPFPGKEPEPKPDAKDAEKLRKRSVDPLFWRDALPHESNVDWDGIAKVMEEEPVRIWERTVKGPRRDIAESIASHFANVSDLKQAKRPTEMPGEKELAESLGRALLQVYQSGRESVLGDRRRQIGITKAQPWYKAAVALAKRLAGISKAVDDEDDEDFDTEPTEKQKKDVNWLATGFVSVLVGAMVQRAIEAGQVSRDANRPAERQERDILDALIGPEGLSPYVQQANLAGRVARAYTNGRVQQGQAMQEEISSVFYTARMDTGTCDPCWAMDGAELDLDTFASQCPNPDCFGEHRCRCGPVFVFRPAMKEAA